jgi:hypothetical protein
MLAHLFLSSALMVAACDKGDDSASATEADADTDSDSDTDADTDSDTDTDNPLDADDDGYETDVDCDDGDGTVNPGASEICGDGKDDNCNGAADGCNWSGDHPLEGITLSTDEHDAALGYATAVCDANGDGQADLVISAANSNGYAGAIYVFYGPVVADRTVDEADYTLEGRAPMFAGAWLDCRGDIDGDGAADLIIGEPGDLSFGSGKSFPGTVYLVPGGGTGTASLDDEASSAWTGIYENDYLGYGVVVLDESGDGTDDIAVSALGTGKEPTNYGATYIIDGPTTGTQSIDAATASFTGTGANYQQPPDIGNAGDLDGDGADDLALGGTGSGYGASVIIFQGPLTGVVTGNDADIRIDDTIAGLGWLPASMGHADVNMDGRDDFFVGNYAWDDYDHRGAAYVFFGNIAAERTVLDADLRLYGNKDDEEASTAIVSPGDIDLDGMDDLVIGAGNAGAGLSGSGGAYLFYGAPAGVYNLGKDAQAAWWADISKAHAGVALAVGDVTGDRVTDIAISVPFSDADQSSVILVPVFNL